MATHVARDPFARGAYHRERHELGKASLPFHCAWCGQVRKYLYSFTWESDGQGCAKSKYAGHARFCNLGCFRCYHS